MRPMLLACLLVIWLTQAMAAQANIPPTQVVDLPQGNMYKLRSPDQRWLLVFEFSDYNSERRLWIVDNQSRKRRLVQTLNRSARLSWSPDSRRFFLNDAWGSNGTACWLIEPSTLGRVDVSALIAKDHPGTFSNHRKAGHLYFEARRWVTSRALLVAMTGHFDERPADGFTYLFHVDLNDGVREVGETRQEEHQ